MEVKKFRIMHEITAKSGPVCIGLAVVHSWGALVTWTSGGIPGCSMNFYPVPFDFTLVHKDKNLVEVDKFTSYELQTIEDTLRAAEKFLTKYRESENAEKTILPE